jgi:hypothetical protein
MNLGLGEWSSSIGGIICATSNEWEIGIRARIGHYRRQRSELNLHEHGP